MYKSPFTWSPGTNSFLAILHPTSDGSRLELLKPEWSSLSKDTGFSSSIIAKVNTTKRCNALDWDNVTLERPLGLITCGMSNGDIELWDPAKIIEKGNTVVSTLSGHTAEIESLALSRLEPHMLASTGAKGEVFVWDMNHLVKPYVPGVPSVRMDVVTGVSWNSQVPHILSTCSNNGFTSVWDLRSRREIMSLTAQFTTSTQAVQWNPQVATQLVAASEDFSSVIHIWDLRQNRRPSKTLVGHEQTITSLSWSYNSPGQLLSTDKAGRTLQWDPSLGTLVEELGSHNQYALWCPQRPDSFASCSLDGKIKFCSIQSNLPNVPVKQELPISPHPRTDSRPIYRSVGASFGYNGKLVIFRSRLSKSNINTPVPQVHIMDIQPLPEVTQRAEKLFRCLSQDLDGSIDRLIDKKIQLEYKSQEWKMLGALVSKDPRQTIIGLVEDKRVPMEYNKSVDEMSPDMIRRKDSDRDRDMDIKISRCVSVGDFGSAVDLCIESNRMAEALLMATCGDKDLLKRTQTIYFEQRVCPPSYLCLVKHILRNDLHSMTHQSPVEDWPHIIAAICTFASPSELQVLLNAFGDRLLKSFRSQALICYMAAGNMTKVCEIWLQYYDPVRTTAVQLQDLVERLSVFQKITGFEASKKDPPHVFERLYQVYCDYAHLMATHGRLDIALYYYSIIPNIFHNTPQMLVLYDRIYRASSSIEAENLRIPPLAFEYQEILCKPDLQNKPPENTQSTDPSLKARVSPNKPAFDALQDPLSPHELPLLEKKRFPKDDKSHIIPEQRIIYTVLVKELREARRCSPINHKRTLDDTERRLKILFDQLNNQQVSETVVGCMLSLVKALEKGEYEEAERIQVELVATCYDACGSWLVGVKRLIGHAKQLNCG
ncbi:hypothetical protein F4703DRAFT_1858252 [Phycomyces blakesleeanus]